MSKKVTTNSFIKEAQSVHGNRYIYSEVNYIKAKNPVIIICKKHGEFRQQPQHHINGSGCPLCNKIIFYNDRNISNKFFENKEGIFYILKLYDINEVFFKVGITTRDINKRLKEFKNYYNVEIVHSQSGDFQTMYKHEKTFLDSFKNFRYKPKKEFKGNTECLFINPYNYMMYEGS